MEGFCLSLRADECYGLMERERPFARTQALAILLSAVLVSLIGFGIIIPLLPFYGQRMGASELEIGLLFASFSAAQLVFSPLWGSLSDRWGRKPFLLLGLIGGAVGYVIMALAPSLGWVFVARLLDGACGGMIPTVRAYVADILEDRERARGFGLIGAAFGLGFIAGPILGSFLARWGLSVPAWGAAGLNLLAAAWAAVGLPEPPRRRSMRLSAWESLRQVWSYRAVRPLLVFDLLFWSCQAVYQTGFALLMYRRFGIGEQQVGYVLAFVGMVGVLTQLGLVGLLTRWLGDGRAFWSGVFVAAVGLGGAAVVPSVPLFILCLVPAAIGSGIAVPTLLSMMSRAVPPALQGSLYGVTSSLESLARIVGPIWGNGSMAFGLFVPFGSAALALAAMGVAAVRYVHQTRHLTYAPSESLSEPLG